MQTTLNVAVVGMGLLFFCATASAQPCAEAMNITLNGTIAKTEQQGFMLGPRINLYVTDPSLDCSPVKVMTYADNTCRVGDSVTQDGFLAQDPDGSWELMGESPFGVESSQFACSK